MRFLVLGFSVIFLTACASSGTIREPDDRVAVVDENLGSIKVHNDQPGLVTDFPAPVDSVWDAVVFSFALLKVDRTLINRQTGEQGNPKLLWSRKFDYRPVSTYLNCGDDPFLGPNADAQPVTVSLVTRVSAKGNGTVLNTQLTGTLSKSGANTGPIYCASTGALEQHIAEMVASRLGQ